MEKRGQDAARAAWLYHIDELAQEQIASELKASRSTVVRLLQ